MVILRVSIFGCTWDPRELTNMINRAMSEKFPSMKIRVLLSAYSEKPMRGGLPTALVQPTWMGISSKDRKTVLRLVETRLSQISTQVMFLGDHPDSEPAKT